MSKKYKLMHEAYPDTKWVTAEELAENEYENWKVISEYGEAEEPQNERDEVAELAAKKFSDHAKRSGNDYWEDIAEEQFGGNPEEKSTDELMSEARDRFQQRKAELQEKKKERAKEKAKRNAPDWAKGDTRPINELSAREFKDLIAEANSSDGSTSSELEEKIEADIEERFNDSEFESAELEESNPDLSEEQLAELEAQGGAFADRAKEIRANQGGVKDTKVRFEGDNKARIATENQEVVTELQDNPDANILQENGGKVIAEVSNADKYQ